MTTTAPGRPVTVGPRAARSAPRQGPRQNAAEIDELVRTHLPVVGYQVNETMARLPGHVHRDDMVSAGLAALAAAAAAYDATTGVPFARYATLRIRGALMDELRSMDWAPRGVRTRAKEMDAADDRLAAQLGRRPDRAELAASLGCSPDEVEAVRRATDRSVISLDAGDGAVAETLAHPQPSPEEQAVQGEQVRYLRAALSSLPERLRTVVEALFVHDRTPADIAAELGVSESRISQIRTEALALLKDGMNTMLEPEAVSPSERPGGVVDRKRQAYFAAVATAAATRRGAAGIAPAGPPERVGPHAPVAVPVSRPLSSLSWGERFG